MAEQEVLGDDAPDLARFFAGEDMTGPLVEDGGKGLVPSDAEPCPEAEDGLSNEDFWGAAELAAAGE